MFGTLPQVIFQKKKKTSTKNLLFTLIGVKIRLLPFFEVSTLCLSAVVHLFDPFLMEGLLEFGLWNAIQESVDCIHHSVVQIELTTLQQFLESRKQSEIARAQIRTVMVVSHYMDLLAGQPSFHDFGSVWSSVIMVQDQSMLQLRPLNSNMLLQLLQYSAVTHRIDFHFLVDCVLINGSSTVEKTTMCTFPADFC